MNRIKITVVVAVLATSLLIGGGVADAARGGRITHTIVSAVETTVFHHMPTPTSKVATMPEKHVIISSPAPTTAPTSSSSASPTPLPKPVPSTAPSKSGMASKVIVTPAQKAYDNQFGVTRDANGYVNPDSGYEMAVNRQLILSSNEITVTSGKLSDILTATTDDGGNIGYLVSEMSDTSVQSNIRPFVDAVLHVPSEQFRMEGDYWHVGTVQIKLMATAPYVAGKPRGIYTAMITVHVVTAPPTPSASYTPTP